MMPDDMKLISLRFPTFFGRMRASWLLLRMLYEILAALLEALWSNGRSASTSLIGLPSGSGVTVNVSRHEVTVIYNRHVTE